MEGKINNLNLKETELRLGLPGTTDNEKQETETINSGLRINNNKRNFPNTNLEINGSTSNQDSAPPPKTQVVGWPPIRSFRKNSLQGVKKELLLESENGGSGIYVKVSMDGAPYLRKIDLSVYKSYPQLLNALEDMFKFTIGQYSERDGFKGSDFLPTYEDKDGDWMLAGDVPWEMFISSCKRLRIMKGSEAGGLGFGGV